MDRAATAKSQWDKEIPGLELGPMVILGRLAEAWQLIQKCHMEPVFTAHGLKFGEFDVLATLRRSGEPYALTPTELYNAMMISSGGMTARLDRLEKAGLIVRKPHPTDRRALQVCLTKKGKTTIETMLPGHIEAQIKALGGLSHADKKELSRILEQLVRTLSQNS